MQGAGDAGAGHAEGVADGDGAAVDVQAVHVDAEVAVRGDHLGGEGLVDLDQVDVADGHSGAASAPAGWPRPGPRPMISGDRPLTPVATMRASGVRPSSRALVSDMMTTAAAPSLSGQQLPAVTRAVGPEDRLELLDGLQGHPCARAVVLRDDGAVRQGDRGDLAGPEAVG